jgi:hypothetical protein
MSTRADLGTPRVRLFSWGLAYTPAAVLAVLLPKCPLCIAAQLALLGVTIPLPSYARALAIVASVVLGTAVIFARRRRGGIACGGRCGSPSSKAIRGPLQPST